MVEPHEALGEAPVVEGEPTVDVLDGAVPGLQTQASIAGSSKLASNHSQKSIWSATLTPKVRSRPPSNPSTEIRSPSMSTQPLYRPGSLMWYMSARTRPLFSMRIGSSSHMGARGR